MVLGPSAAQAAFCHLRVDSSSSAKSCTISLVCRSSFNAAANSKMGRMVSSGFGKRSAPRFSLARSENFRVALVRELLLEFLGHAIRHRPAEFIETLGERATMIGLAFGHHLEAAANAIGGANPQPRPDRIATIGLGRADRLEERHHRGALGIIGFAKRHELACAVAIGMRAVLKRLHFLFESRLIDDAGAKGAQQLFEFEIFGHSFLRVSRALHGGVHVVRKRIVKSARNVFNRFRLKPLMLSDLNPFQSLLPILLLVLALCRTASAGSAPPASEQSLGPTKVALTIDDLPTGSGEFSSYITREEVTRRIIATLKANGLSGVYGFSNGEFMEWDPKLTHILKMWRAAKYPLGNHTYHHFDLAKVGVKTFLDDIARQDQLLATLETSPRVRRVFRYPFLSEGSTLEECEAVRKYLAQNGYRIAEVSTDYSDRRWNDTFNRCFSQHDEESIQWLKDHVIDSADRRLRQVNTTSTTLTPLSDPPDRAHPSQCFHRDYACGHIEALEKGRRPVRLAR